MLLDCEQSSDLLARTRRERKTLTGETANQHAQSMFESLQLQVAERRLALKGKLPRLYDHQLYKDKERLQELMNKQTEFRATALAKKQVYKGTQFAHMIPNYQEVISYDAHGEPILESAV